jgi:hypothetical protein
VRTDERMWGIEQVQSIRQVQRIERVKTNEWVRTNSTMTGVATGNNTMLCVKRDIGGNGSGATRMAVSFL